MICPRGSAQQPAKQILRQALARHTRAEREEILSKLDLSSAPALDIHEWFHSAQAEARRMLVKYAEGNLQIGFPIKFAAEP